MTKLRFNPYCQNVCVDICMFVSRTTKTMQKQLQTGNARPFDWRGLKIRSVVILVTDGAKVPYFTIT